MADASLDEIVGDFHTLLFDLLQEFYKISPNSIVANNRDKVEKVLITYSKSSDPGKRYKIIDIFVLKVLIFKPEIDRGDDSFFLRRTYEEEAEGDVFIMNVINEIKKVWSVMNSQNKENILQYLQLLCELAQNYFLAKGS